MSHKGISPIAKSKQIPRIFQRHNPSTSPGRRNTWGVPDNVPADVSIITEHHNGLLDAIESTTIELKQVYDNRGNKTRDNGQCQTSDYTTGHWATLCPSVSAIPVASDSEPIDGCPNAAETVADIEKWLKSRTESISSMDLDPLKSEVEDEEGVGVERYLADNLSHAFLNKNHDDLPSDIDLSDDKLHLCYDPILQELQADKLLGACEKSNDFIPPEFHLDRLDPMALSPEEMMVAGEMLPSTSDQSILIDDLVSDGCTSNELIGNSNSMDSEICESVHKSTHTNIYEPREETDIGVQTEFNEEDTESFEISNAELLKLTDSKKTHQGEVTQSSGTIERKVRKKRKKVLGKSKKCKDNFEGEDNDGVMAVVAISTDKVSNMTQIVINTGKEEQIYQGKTSELIEATGNFPKLAKIDGATGNWGNEIDNDADAASSTHHELVISDALEELGITEESLQPTIVNENGKIWFCPRNECNREFNKVYALKSHLFKAHYGIRPFKCDFAGCTWAFHSEFKLKRHKETHLKRKDFPCKVAGCERKFTTIYNLWSHEKLHMRPNRITCHVPNCQERFQTKRALELHMKMHDQRHAPYVCNHEGCGKRYYSSNALTSHLRCHSYKEIDVKCSWPDCGKIFDKPCRLKQHMRSHTGSKPYTCTYEDCQSAFPSSSKLKRHEKKHTNERKFVCDIDGCGKAFMRSEHLKEHSLTHQEGRLFQCHMCDSSFAAKSSLYVHIKKHQIKEAVDTITQDSCTNLHRKFTDESQSSNDQFVKQTEMNEENDELKTFVELPSSEESLVSGQCFVQSRNVTSQVGAEVEGQNLNNVTYHCGMDNCSKTYKTESSMRAHMFMMHLGPNEDCDKSSIGITDIPTVSNVNHILYTTQGAMDDSANQIVMIEPGNTIILNTPMENLACLPEPEPPPPIHTENSYLVSANSVSPDQREKISCQGSARTDLTRDDVWRLKAGNFVNDTANLSTDLVLGTSGLSAGLLLTEELPSMYYQDDISGQECQILLLDSGTSGNPLNLRSIE